MSQDAFKKIGIVGAGMMGAGIASVCAKSGMSVLLFDSSSAATLRALGHVVKKGGEHASRLVKSTSELTDFKKCDLVVEAIVENTIAKQNLLAEIEPWLAPKVIWASNTSGIPITTLMSGARYPDRCIGLHFFSPVEAMRLVEVVPGKQTSADTLARGLQFVKQINKVAVTVNDGYGFYTTRVFSAYVLEGVELVAEGYDPAAIEDAAKIAGMAVPPLQILDEIGLALLCAALDESERYIPKRETPGIHLLKKMVYSLGRTGKAAKKGFYDYENGRHLWAGLSKLATGTPKLTAPALLQERLILAQCAETARALEEGVLHHPRDADVAALLGIGFSPQTGGPMSYMTKRGLSEIIDRLNAFAAEYGMRYAPAGILERMLKETMA